MCRTIPAAMLMQKILGIDFTMFGCGMQFDQIPRIELNFQFFMVLMNKDTEHIIEATILSQVRTAR